MTSLAPILEPDPDAMLRHLTAVFGDAGEGLGRSGVRRSGGGPAGPLAPSGPDRGRGRPQQDRREVGQLLEEAGGPDQLGGREQQREGQHGGGEPGGRPAPAGQETGADPSRSEGRPAGR